MKSLIIGAAGFVGRYLAAQLHERMGFTVTVTKLPFENIDFPGAAVIDLDILDPEAVQRAVDSEEPDVVYHLAAQSSVALSWKRPGLTVDINVKGALNVMEAVRNAQRRARLILIGSGEEYGSVRPEDIPILEDVTPIRPGNPYAATKAAQNMLGTLYARAYGMDVINVRAFNHIGAGQSPQFVVADFAGQIAKIERGEQERTIFVGNLAARRDFCDVRDIVRAYGLLAHKGRSGETYNVGSGQAIEIRSLLSALLSLSPVRIDVVSDPSKYRPIDVPVIEASIEKMGSDTGWKPEIALNTTLQWIMESARKGT
jgi:GDP-4-dehydro-6-deoxy-D-mannose reductase